MAGHPPPLPQPVILIPCTQRCMLAPRPAENILPQGFALPVLPTWNVLPRYPRGSPSFFGSQFQWYLRTQALLTSLLLSPCLTWPAFFFLAATSSWHAVSVFQPSLPT